MRYFFFKHRAAHDDAIYFHFAEHSNLRHDFTVAFDKEMVVMSTHKAGLRLHRLIYYNL